MSKETGLLQEWSKNGPPLVWKAKGIGEGMGGVAIAGGRIFTTGDSDDSAWLFALNEADGKPVWTAKVGRSGKYGNMVRLSGPRTTPTVDGDRLYVLSQHGDLACFTTADGKEVWRVDYVKDFGGIVPVWGFAEWFATSSYDAGGGAAKLSKGADGEVTATEVFFSNRLKNHHGGVVLVDGYLYGSFDPGILTCVELKTGNVVWSERGPGKGAVTYADGRLYCRNERSNAVHLVDADPKGYIERGRFEQPDRTREPAWPHPVIANGKLYLRDQDLLLCYDVKAK
jgi:outer membrane protein assembly factor BamB